MIATNAGLETVVVEEVKAQGSIGFNALKETYEDLMKAGIVDR